MLGEIDGEIRLGLAQHDEGGVLDPVSPDVVLGHDPWKRALHPDHRHARWLTVDGVVATTIVLYRSTTPTPSLLPRRTQSPSRT